jgi:nitroimidazol reductase NimA-like FMN-containing flavoprotein (pyridoxamine 5'-phosphate oxidase superfamily)
MDLSDRVCQTVDAIDHATVATVSGAGQPWNTPVYVARQGGHFYWISRSDAQHSMNIRNNARAFLVIYDSSRTDASGAALYAQAYVTELQDEAHNILAIQAIYRRRQQPPPTPASFAGSSPHRVYQAVVRRAWTNVVHESDISAWDERVEIAFTL